MELSFLLALVLLVGLIALAYAALRLGQAALRLPDDVREWRDLQRLAAAERTLLDAMRAYLDGDTPRAARLAQKAEGCRAADIAARLIEAGEGHSGRAASGAGTDTD